MTRELKKEQEEVKLKFILSKIEQINYDEKISIESKKILISHVIKLVSNIGKFDLQNFLNQYAYYELPKICPGVMVCHLFVAHEFPKIYKLNDEEFKLFREKLLSLYEQIWSDKERIFWESEFEDNVCVYGKQYRNIMAIRIEELVVFIIFSKLNIAFEILSLSTKILEEIISFADFNNYRIGSNNLTHSSAGVEKYKEWLIKNKNEGKNLLKNEMSIIENVFRVPSIDILVGVLEIVYEYLMQLKSSLNEYPLSISFLFYEKKSRGYKWLLLPHQRIFLKYMFNEYGSELKKHNITKDDLINLDKFVFIGSDEHDIKDCSGYCWKARKKENELIYKFEGSSGKYKEELGGEKINEKNWIESVLKIEKYLWFKNCDNEGASLSECLIYQTDINNQRRGSFGLQIGTIEMPIDFRIQIVITAQEEKFRDDYLDIKKQLAEVELTLTNTFLALNIINKKNRKVILYSLKSAIAAIMSRNMSHNIGSHVIADLVAKGGRAKQGELNIFFRYLQNRMDFIAQITTEFPEWTYPAYFTKEVMRIFYENFILLDRIGVSEGLHAYEWPENRDGWKQSDMRGKIIVRSGISRWEIEEQYWKLENKDKDNFTWVVNEYAMGKLEDDLQLAIPGGIVGYHALYVIIENVIRNSAKHDYAVNRIKVINNEDERGVEKLILLIDSNGNWEKFDKKDNGNTNETDLNRFQAVVIDSQRIDSINMNHPANGLEIKLEGEDTVREIKHPRYLFIGCRENLGVVEPDQWEKKNLGFHKLSNVEWDELIKRKVGAEKNKKYDVIVDFLTNVPLRVNIRIDDPEDKDYVWVTVWDDIPQYTKVNYDKDQDKNSKRETQGDVREEEIKKRKIEEKEVNLFGFLNDRLRQSFIKETGELKKENWGLAELKICAGFLQNRRPEEIGDSGKVIVNDDDFTDEGYPRMIIKAIPVDKKGKEKARLNIDQTDNDNIYFQGYRFWMKKPKLVALTGDYENKSNFASRGES